MTITVKLFDGDTIIAWQTTNGAYFQQYDSDLQPLGSPVEVTTGSTDWLSATPLQGSGFSIVWDTSAAAQPMAQNYDSNGNPLGSTYAWSGAPPIASMASTSLDEPGSGGPYTTLLPNDDTVAVTFSANRLEVQQYDPADKPVGPDYQLTLQTGPGGFSEPATTALASGGYVVTYPFNQSDNGDLYVSRFAADGTHLGDATIATTGFQGIGAPSIAALADGGFVVSWVMSEYPDRGSPASTQPPYAVFAQEFAADGSPATSQQMLGVLPANSSPKPEIDAFANGQYTISWTADGITQSQSFTEQGTPVVPDTNDAIVTPAVSYAVPDGPQDVTLIGAYAQTVTANNLGDTITSNDYGSTIIGGTGNDTLIAGHGADTLTGGGGSDAFVFNYLPWNAGSITDFNTATDTLNLSGIFSTIGYTGSNPVADGYLQFVSDGQGDTKVYVDPQGPSTSTPILVTTLDHVSPSSITPADYGYGASSSGTITISGTTADQQVQDNEYITPFSHVTIADTNSGATENLTVTLSDAGNGHFSDLTTGSYDATTGVYTDTGTAAQVTTALDDLVFDPTQGQVPPGDTVTTTFTIDDSDSAGASASDSNTSVVATAMPEPNVLTSFDGTDGSGPYASLTMDSAGDLFGTTQYGGADNKGTVFEIANNDGTYASTPTVLFSFDGTNGSQPVSSVTLDAAGNIYGTTQDGGANNEGTVFEIAKTADGYAATPTILANFDGANGENPWSGLISDAAGDLFGTTAGGGANNDGTVFELADNDGTYSAPILLASFDGSNGSVPGGSLIADAHGDLFGTTEGGGAHGDGTVFEIAHTADGYAAPVTLLSFDVSDGERPIGALTMDSAGDLFGVTTEGGAIGTPYGGGTVFELADTGGSYASAPTILANFSYEDIPSAGLLIDAAGNLYGTEFGGAVDDGQVFEIAKTADGYASQPTTLTDFNTDDAANGLAPGATLIADAAGNLYGTTEAGGTSSDGTVYELSGTGYVTSGSGGGQTGETLTANDTAGQQLTGTPYNDTFYAEQNSVIMTGDGGHDTFIFNALPWNAGSITDFNTATDTLNLSGIFNSIGYTGGNPVTDGYLQFASDGQGDTQVYVNSHSSSDPWPTLITTLDGVSPSSITPADYGYGSSSGGGGGQTVDESQPSYTAPAGVTNIVLTGGAAQTVTGNNQGDTITSNDYGSTLIGGTGNDTLIAGHGADQLTGNGGEDSFVFNYLPWNAGQITDFNPSTDTLNLSGIMQSIGYSGSNPVADGYVNFAADGNGGTVVYVDPQGPSTEIPITVTTLDHVSPSALHQTGDYMFA